MRQRSVPRKVFQSPNPFPPLQTHQVSPIGLPEAGNIKMMKDCRSYRHKSSDTFHRKKARAVVKHGRNYRATLRSVMITAVKSFLPRTTLMMIPHIEAGTPFHFVTITERGKHGKQGYESRWLFDDPFDHVSIIDSRLPPLNQAGDTSVRLRCLWRKDP